MERKIKKSLSLLLAVLMLMSVMPMSIFAADDVEIIFDGKSEIYYSDEMSDDAIDFFSLFSLPAGEVSGVLGDQLEGTAKEFYNGLLDYYVKNKNTNQYVFVSSSDDLTIDLRCTKNYTEDGHVSLSISSDEQALLTILIYGVAGAAHDAMFRDYPELFWLRSFSFGYEVEVFDYDNDLMNDRNVSEISVTMKIKSITYTPTAIYSDPNTAMTEVYAAVDSLVGAMSAHFEEKGAEATREYKLKYIHDYICENSDYADAALEHEQTTGQKNHIMRCIQPFFTGDKLHVCEGYAKVFKVLCDRFDIPCILVSGYAGGPHMWNYVQMDDGDWYLVDITWDDQKSGIYYTHFLAGWNSNSEDFGFDTIKDGRYEEYSFSSAEIGDVIVNGKEFSYPTLSDVSYDSHDYVPVVTAPTCKDEGYTTYTCSICENSYTADFVDKGDHSYTFEVTKEATHLEKGETTYTCSVCGDSYTEEIAKLEDHTYEKVVTAPTCNDKGYTTYTCACGDTYTADEKPALGHNFGWVVDKEATCGKDGKKHEKCSRCTATRSANTTIPATGNHSYETKVTAPTCNDEGYTTYTCACGYSYEADKKTALGHNFGWIIDKEETCGETGLKHEKCSRCTETRSLNTTIPATGKHSYTSEITTPATHTKEGVETFTCSGCGDNYTKSVAKLKDHTYTSKVTAPTCTEKGYTTYTCACGETYKADYKDALKHTGGTANCKDKAVCTRCGNTYGEVNAANHKTVVTDKAVAATCKNTGLTAGSHCSACNTVIVAQTTTAKLDHSYTSKVTAPTCTEEGYTTYTCACGEIYKDNYKDALKHTGGTANCKESAICTRCNKPYGEVNTANHKTVVTDNAVAATCKNTGLTAGSHCSACNTVIVAQTTTAKLDHSYTSEITTPATHLKEGVKTFTCSGCGTTYTETVAKLEGHTYNEVVTKPTCDDEGYTTYTCACGHTYTGNKTNKLDHDFGWVIDENATCGKDGKKHEKCSRCTETRSLNTVIPATGDHSYTSKITTPATHLEEGVKTFTCSGCRDSYTEAIAKIAEHTYEKTVVEPTCTADGTATYTCACGETKTETIASRGHSLDSKEAKAPTCTEPGYEAYEYCTACTYTTYKAVSAKGHSYIPEVTTPATHLQEGVKTFTCSGCNHSYIGKIDKTPDHTYIASGTTAADCENKGFTTYDCACGDSYNGDYVDALGHDYEDGICTRCGDDKASNCSHMCHKNNFIWKILLFFFKLFKIQRECECGIAHY